MCKQMIIKNLLCSVIVCKFPPDQGGLVTGEQSHNIAGSWQRWRFKLSLNGAGPCGCAKERDWAATTGSELLSEKVTWSSSTLLHVQKAAAANPLLPKNPADTHTHEHAHIKRVNKWGGKKGKVNNRNDFCALPLVHTFVSQMTPHDTQLSGLVKHKPVIQTNTGLYLHHSSHSMKKTSGAVGRWARPIQQGIKITKGSNNQTLINPLNIQNL